MSARIGWPAVVRQAGEIAGRRGHDVLIMLLVLLLGAELPPTREDHLAEHDRVRARRAAKPEETDETEETKP